MLFFLLLLLSYPTEVFTHTATAADATDAAAQKGKRPFELLAAASSVRQRASERAGERTLARARFPHSITRFVHASSSGIEPIPYKNKTKHKKKV